MIKEMTQALSTFMESTNKEFENIKEIIILNFRGYKKEHEEFKKYKIDIDTRMHNLIGFQKEINHKWEAIGSLVEGMIEGESYQIKTSQSNSSYSEYKKKLIEENIKQQSIIKAILYDKYIPNKARIVTKSGETIKSYRVTISHKFNKTIYYVNYKGKWQRLRNIIEQLRNEGIVYGFKNIIKGIRSRHFRKYKNEKQEKLTQKKRIREKKRKTTRIINKRILLSKY